LDGFETLARAKGFRAIAGVDEAGRGPLAGPVVAAAVILPERFPRGGIRDSKALAPAAREKEYERIAAEAVTYAAAHSTPEEIDQLNILQASLLAMRRAVEALAFPPDFVFVDGHLPIPPSWPCPMASAPRRRRGRRRTTAGTGTLFAAPSGPAGCVFALETGCPRAGRPVPEAPTVWCSIGQEAVVAGDSLCLSIMAASVLAKVTRDRMMEEYERADPGYGFASHKGYPTPEHLAALRKLGPCPIHRRTFHGVTDPP
jgi:ribonuclease HII